MTGHRLKKNAHKWKILAYEFPSDFQWENKETHKLSITEADQGCWFSSNIYKVAMHNRIHDSVYIDLDVHSVTYMYVRVYVRVWTLSGESAH